MKILTNIQNAKVSGISAVMRSIVGGLSARHKNVELIGVNIVPDTRNRIETSSKSLKIIHRKANLPHINEVMEKAKSIDDIKDSYQELIDIYDEIVKTEKPDLVILNGTIFHPWTLKIVAEQNNIDTIVHYHGVLTKERTHYAPEKLKLVKEIEKSFDTPNMGFIFPSELAKITVEKEVFGHKVENFTIIANPVPPSFINYRKRERTNPILVGAVGRWRNIKNVDFLVELAKEMKTRGMNKLQMISSHDHPDVLEDGTILEDIIDFRKARTHSNMAEFYKKMSIIVSPSIFETFGNVPLEAISAGTPALINDSMGVAEVFKNIELSDYVIDFDDVNEVISKIEEHANELIDPETTKIIENKYTWASYINKYIEYLSKF